MTHKPISNCEFVDCPGGPRASISHPEYDKLAEDVKLLREEHAVWEKHSLSELVKENQTLREMNVQQAAEIEVWKVSAFNWERYSAEARAQLATARSALERIVSLKMAT